MTDEDFDSFYKKYQRFSIYAAFCIVNDREMAKDISQEVFIKLYLMNDRLDCSNSGKIKSLINRMTINKSIDYLRRASTKLEVCGIHNDQGEKCDNTYNPEMLMLSMEKEKYIKIALERLYVTNPINYDIFVKTRIYGLSTAHVANEYKITVNNINNRNKRSKIWIIKELERISRQRHIE